MKNSSARSTQSTAHQTPRKKWFKKKDQKTKARKPLRVSLKSLLQLIVKVLLVFGLLFFLFQKGFLSPEATREALKHWEFILPSALALLLANCLAAVRWHLLLHAQGIRQSFKRTFQLSWIGNFFNLALPGAVSGDFVKIFYIGKQTQGQSTRALGSILFDRVAGLSALIIVSCIALIIQLLMTSNTPLPQTLTWMIELAATSVVFFYSYLFFMKERHDPLLKLLRWIDRRLPLFSAFTRVYESLRHYHHHKKIVIQGLLISGLIHLVVGWSCFQLTSALGETHLSLLSLYVILGLGLLVTAIPLAPGGIGTGNVAFLYLFHLLGSERGADFFSLYVCVTLALGSLGGLVYFRFRSHEPAVALDLKT
ncbi:MAG: lysylphosphatidylglycerol synthase transmembrane domain-containing protein [Bdellovibrionia bacterium]